jgi:hypothetical protein
MAYRTIAVEIDHGRVVVPRDERLPERGRGLLTVLAADSERARERVSLPIVAGTPGNVIDPSKAQLDASLWGDDEITCL